MTRSQDCCFALDRTKLLKVLIFCANCMNTFIPLEANKSGCNSLWTSETKKGNLLPAKMKVMQDGAHFVLETEQEYCKTGKFRCIEMHYHAKWPSRVILANTD